MNDFDAWIFFDGPPPESLRQVLDALRDPLPEDEELELLALLEQVDAEQSPPSEGASGPVLLDDADVEPAPPTPGAPEAVRVPCLVFADAPPLQKKEEEAPAPPVVTDPLALLRETALSAKLAVSIQPALAASGGRPAPAVQVVGAKEQPRTLELPVMDPSQGTRRLQPASNLYDYVAYRVELDLWPASRAGVQEKYEVDGEAGHEDVVRHWNGQFAASPEVCAWAEATRVSWLEQGREMERARAGGK